MENFRFLVKDINQRLGSKGVHMVFSSSQSSTRQNYWVPLIRNILSVVGIKIVFVLKKGVPSCNFETSWYLLI